MLVLEVSILSRENSLFDIQINIKFKSNHLKN